MPLPLAHVRAIVSAYTIPSQAANMPPVPATAVDSDDEWTQCSVEHQEEDHAVVSVDIGDDVSVPEDRRVNINKTSVDAADDIRHRKTKDDASCVSEAAADNEFSARSIETIDTDEWLVLTEDSNVSQDDDSWAGVGVNDASSLDGQSVDTLRSCKTRGKRNAIDVNCDRARTLAVSWPDLLVRTLTASFKILTWIADNPAAVRIAFSLAAFVTVRRAWTSTNSVPIASNGAGNAGAPYSSVESPIHDAIDSSSSVDFHAFVYGVESNRTWNALQGVIGDGDTGLANSFREVAMTQSSSSSVLFSSSTNSTFHAHTPIPSSSSSSSDSKALTLVHDAFRAPEPCQGQFWKDWFEHYVLNHLYPAATKNMKQASKRHVANSDKAAPMMSTGTKTVLAYRFLLGAQWHASLLSKRPVETPCRDCEKQTMASSSFATTTTKSVSTIVSSVALVDTRQYASLSQLPLDFVGVEDVARYKVASIDQSETSGPPEIIPSSSLSVSPCIDQPTPSVAPRTRRKRAASRSQLRSVKIPAVLMTM